MTEKTILTQDQIDLLLEGVLRASGSRLGNYTYQKTLDELRSSIRAIEQALLQSPEIQELRKESRRLDKLEQDYFEPVEGGIRKHIDYQIEVDAETFSPKSNLKLVRSRHDR